ncbi:rCG25031 [Rattus norvegicus]|uniref:RCG25031 n=1 Tax=Rattus norvegicus TaxID=10116 RepID=A6KFI5_RAT|nr:rCG25031 [Rattus norvegicus]
MVQSNAHTSHVSSNGSVRGAAGVVSCATISTMSSP